MKKIAITVSIVCLSALAQGCLSQDTAGDTAQQEQDRETGVADKIAANLAPMKGTYVGTYNNSTIELSLKAPRIPSTGNGDLGLAAQPVLAGGLLMEVPIYVVSANAQPMMAF